MMLADLHTRRRVPELMDDPALDPAEHRRALIALARINRLSNSAGVLWPAIARLANELKRPIRVLDVATGSGDIPRALLARAKRAGIDLEIEACDISETAIAEAKRTSTGVSYFAHDAIHLRLPSGFDIVACSLFLHHLSNEDAIALLTNMESAARHLLLVNDLARSRFNYCAIWLAVRFLTRSRVVRFDGPASVRSAFSVREAAALAEAAGLHGAVVESKFPCRYLLSWRRR